MEFPVFPEHLSCLVFVLLFGGIVTFSSFSSGAALNRFLHSMSSCQLFSNCLQISSSSVRLGSKSAVRVCGTGGGGGTGGDGGCFKMLALSETGVGRSFLGGDRVHGMLWLLTCGAVDGVGVGTGGVVLTLLAVTWLPLQAGCDHLISLLVGPSLFSGVKKPCCCLPLRMSSKMVKSASLMEATECFGPLAFTVVMAVLTSME